MRIVLNYTKLDAMGYVAHLDFQRLWQRMFRMAGITVQKTQGFNPHPKIRFAVPLATGFQSRNELVEAHLTDEINETEAIDSLNRVSPEGLEILAATKVPEQFPKITALVDALEYEIQLPQGLANDTGQLNPSGWIQSKGGEIQLSDYLVSARMDAGLLRLLLKVKNQKTIRPDLITIFYYNDLRAGDYTVIRTGIFARQDKKIIPVPTGLGIID